MPNDPKGAREKRPPQKDRNNSQSDHEGSAHDPDEFDRKNPEKAPEKVKDDK
ncbi:hypothetical protein [Pseudosulfitobacter sp. DSM 107133]|uniref:hypothetical protein n=1 Tax=Pseudosulfitobacter sp. DSM 107133 TaxID=2883100 RepID=UPI0013B39900|nr:hypothetical protein [Pseudosulfitobacter sp. DSM 107133]UOA29357.1 hypothetical protein DSM107133_04118 [Pseudosulfitobacter sp. DSM 107133]